MKHTIAKIFVIIVASILARSCNWYSQIVHNEDVIAEVGKYKLYRHTLEAAIPPGLSSEDSAAFAKQYILSWTQDKVFLDKAESLLSDEEKDVSAEMEQYRETLLKYRYSQLYISERLDTTVREEEIEKYYEDNKDRFRLGHPAYKGLFYTFSGPSPDIDAISRLLSSKESADLIEGDSLARENALRVYDYSSAWADSDMLSREASLDYRRLVSSARKGLVTMEDEHSNKVLLLFSEIIPEGSVAPIDYCTENIKDIILSARKRSLASTLEQDLLEEARSKNLVTVY